MGPGTKRRGSTTAASSPDGEVTFFDDGSNPPIHHQSRAVRIALDFKTHEARLRLRLHAPRPAAARREPGQHADARRTGTPSWATAGCPRSASTRRDGSLLFDAHLPFDMTFYRAFRFPWSGRPQSPPAVLASLNNTGEETIVHASWNGATDVASWRVLAGQAARVAGGAGHDPGQRLRKLDDPARRSTPTWRCRRSTRPATCSAPRGRCRSISYAASLPSPAVGMRQTRWADGGQ